MAGRQHDESDFPPGIGAPARRALAHAGYSSLEQLAHVRESELLRLHGVGPKAVVQLRAALRARGQSFEPEPKGG
jgi:ERCC4-type nuclease